MTDQPSLVTNTRNWLFSHGRYLLNLGSTFASQGATAITLLILTPLLVQNLGESTFSTYGVLLNLILVASVFDFGLNTGLVHRLIQEPTLRNALLNAVFFFYLFVFCLVFPIIFILFKVEWVSFGGESGRMALLLAAIVVQNMMAMFFEAIFQSVNKVFISKWIRVLRTAVEAFLLYWFSRKGSIELLLLISLGVNFIYILMLFFFSARQVPYTINWEHFNSKTLFSQFQYSFWYFQNMIATVITYNVQILLLNHYLSAIQMTIFLLVFRFFEIFRTGLTNFTFVLFPSISMQQAAKDWTGIRSSFRKVLVRVFLITGLVFIGMVWKGDELFSWWSHYHTAESSVVYYFYAGYVFFLILDHVSVTFLSALKYNRVPAIVSTFQGAMALFLTWYFLPLYSMKGAVWASLLAFATTSLIFNPVYLLYRLKKEKQSS